MPIKVTRGLLNAALSGVLKTTPMRTDPLFGFQVPLSLAGVDAKLLTPRETWTDPQAYDVTAEALVGMFEKNFAKYETLVDAEVRNARPGLKPAAAA